MMCEIPLNSSDIDLMDEQKLVTLLPDWLAAKDISFVHLMHVEQDVEE